MSSPYSPMVTVLAKTGNDIVQKTVEMAGKTASQIVQELGAPHGVVIQDSVDFVARPGMSPVEVALMGLCCAELGPGVVEALLGAGVSLDVILDSWERSYIGEVTDWSQTTDLICGDVEQSCPCLVVYVQESDSFALWKV